MRPGGLAGTRRIMEAMSLSYSSCSEGKYLLYSSPYREKYWWSWRRIHYLVKVIQSDGIQTVGGWERFRSICLTVSRPKRTFLFIKLSPLFSDGSIAFLFNGWRLLREDLEEYARRNHD